MNKGIKPDLKPLWDVDLGVTYIPWAKIREDQLEDIQEGGMLDMDTLSPGEQQGPFTLSPGSWSSHVSFGLIQ